MNTQYRFSDMVNNHRLTSKVTWCGNPTLLPSTAGNYVLLLKNSKTKCISVGSLGEREFDMGYYVYVGSAKGSGGLKARVGRHFRNDENKKKRWHIDYIRAEMTMCGCWVLIDNAYESVAETSESECDIAQLLLQFDNLPFNKIGSSDCKCISHVFKVTL